MFCFAISNKTIEVNWLGCRIQLLNISFPSTSGKRFASCNQDTAILPCIFVSTMSAESFPPSFQLLLSSLVPFDMPK